MRAEAAIMGTSLHTLVQMVDNGLGLTFVPAMAIDAGILEGTGVDARPLQSDHGFRRISLVWRRSSPREEEFRILTDTLRNIAATVVRGRVTSDRAESLAPGPVTKHAVPAAP
jgi:LysR family hydrogen peroxide-inducible transcriptional activator